ncbi:mitochondrial carrier domain-containing protein [Suillus subluteus]|nr:mitochondrial carrier domain-containing protein [Suillus subluteus]
MPLPFSTLESFLCGGLAGCIACVYKDALDVLAKTWRNEGIRSSQRGLGPATLLNGSRLGFYESFRRAINCSIGKSITDQISLTSIVADAANGIIGSIVYSPILPVGTQHHCKNSFDAWVTIFRTDKFWGLLRGVDAAILRSSYGIDSVQLPTYKWAKNQLGSHGLYPSNSILTYLASSSVSGICVCVTVVMHPADTALTRVYNQPTTCTSDGRLAGTLQESH